MPLSDSAKKFYFGHVEPQQLRDFSGPGNTLIYEGYGTPGVPTSVAGFVILKHTVDPATNEDIQAQPKVGVVWDLRDLYNYNNP